MNDIQGWLNIYKPAGISSFKAIKKIKDKFKIKKIGHAGTLDPLAEGVLPIAIGKSTKLISFVNNDIKEYEFEIKWGANTTTDDTEGEITEVSSKIPSLKEINSELINFKGEILQKPPKASAVKINGIRAYQLLRKNENFETREKKVYVKKIKVLNSSSELITKILIECGKGFYIRSFARDIAENLNTKGHIHSLKRTKVGKFVAKNANLLDDMLKIRQRLVEFKGFHASISMLDDILAYEIDDEKNKDCISKGKGINININQLEPLSLNFADRKMIFLTEKGNVISFGKLDGDLFKPHKVLI